MLVKALVRDVIPVPSQDVVKCVFETTNPLQILEVRIFTKNDSGKVNAQRLSEQKGKHVMLPLTAEIYKGQLQYQFPFGEVFQPEPPKAA